MIVVSKCPIGNKLPTRTETQSRQFRVFNNISNINVDGRLATYTKLIIGVIDSTKTS